MVNKKILVLTFSPNGRCAELAEAAAYTLYRADFAVMLGDVTLPSDRAELRDTEISADTVIAFFPVHVGRLPELICDFLASSRIYAKNAALVLGYGSCGIGDAAADAKRAFAEAGIELTRVLAYPLPHSHAPLVKSEQLLPPGFSDVERFVFSAARGDAAPGIYVKRTVASRIPRALALRFTASVPKTDIEKCVFCGKCAAVCPTGAASPDRTTVNGADCLRCASCVYACPEGAKTLRLHPFAKSKMKKAFARRGRAEEL